MPFALIDSAGLIQAVIHKPSPFTVIPDGGRMVPCNPPLIDSDLADLVMGSAVAPEESEVSFVVTPKDQATIARVITMRKTALIQKFMDDKAKENHYDGILSAASYATSAHPMFGPEGVAYRDWRDACWSYGYQVIAEVQSGARSMPSDAELLLELPALSLP